MSHQSIVYHHPFFELLSLPLGWHLVIAVFAVIWMLTLRMIWRRNWLERFFGVSQPGNA